MYIFKGKIKCLRCGQNYRGKKERKRTSYICSGYHNYGSNYCVRNIIYEDELLYIIEKHYYLQYKQNIQQEQISSYVDLIKIGDDGIKIAYTDNTESIISRNCVKY